MKKRFVTHKKKNSNIYKIMFFVIIILFSFIITFNGLLASSIKALIGSSGVYKSLVATGLNDKKFTLNLLNPSDLLRLSLNYKLTPSIEQTTIDKIQEHKNAINPLVYIYNTHDGESYSSSLIEAYNIKYTVKMASYILSDYLEDLGIESYIEEESITEFMNNNGLIYKSYYEASRYYFEKRKKEYPSLIYFIDIHRDAALKDTTTALLDGKPYAKLLFVVGKDHENYQKNLETAKKINSKIDKNLTRGVYEKSGAGVNGVYNQDLSENAVLLEVGGKENTIEEVNNSLEMFSHILLEVINGG